LGLLSLGGLLLAAPAAGPAWAAASPPLVYYSVTPCRVLDTRQPVQGPALASGTARLVTVTGAACGVPANARAIQANIAAVGPTGAGNVRLYPGDGAAPATSALNFAAGQTRANNGAFALAGNGNGSLALLATVTGPGSVNVVLDVAGYFVVAPIRTVFTIVMENHDYAEVVGSPNAPYINSLIAGYGLATSYLDSLTHPSLPNYLYLISGDTQYPGLIDVDPTTAPYFPSSANNLGNQLQTGGIAWRSYQESMGTPCKLTSSGNYAPKHDPFLYFTNIQSAPICAAANVDYSQFAGDLAAGTYRYMWITPNLINDGHDPANDPVAALQATDAWLAIEVPKILASPAYRAGGVLFITWDEAEGRNGDSADQVPMIVISPMIKSAGFTSSHPYNHASYLATVEDIFGFPRLGAAVGATSMMEFFAP
jgi:hypothetical protein